MSYSPVRRSVKHFHISASMFASLNLHVLRTPPAFILSQDQTLSKFDSSDSYFSRFGNSPDSSGLTPPLSLACKTFVNLLRLGHFNQAAYRPGESLRLTQPSRSLGRRTPQRRNSEYFTRYISHVKQKI